MDEKCSCLLVPEHVTRNEKFQWSAFIRNAKERIFLQRISFILFVSGTIKTIMFIDVS